MVNLYVEVENVDEVIAGLVSLGEKIVKIAAEAARHEAEFELPLTRDRVPIDTGQLRLSGRVEGPDLSGGVTATAGIAYGGPAGSGLNDVDVDYAIEVHEDLNQPHKVGQAKYVESVVMEERESGRAPARMGAEIVAALAKLSEVKATGFASKSGSYLRGSTGRFAGSTR